MMKKTISKIAVGLTFGLALLSSNVTQAADLKIATLDLRKIMLTSPDAKAIETRLKKEFGSKDQELIAKDKSFKETVEKLQRNGAIMSVAERTKLEQEAGAKQKELQRLQMKFQEEGGKRQQEETQKFLDKVKKSVTQVAVKKRVDMVLLSDAVPYFNNPQMDITQEVMQHLAGK